jgi:hypothetical protein|tara:strand:+ start:451 stop:897 length:447 start_codon:yes stop_codon:yes gene_type:complete
MAKSAVKKSQVAEVIFRGIQDLPEDRKSQGVTAEDIFKFVQEHAGGNPLNVGVRTVASVDPKAEQPFPFESKRTLYDADGQPKTTLRGKVVWQLINGNCTLQEVDMAHRSIKARRFHALLDALNGGQSPSAKATWGNAFVELFVIQPQ